MTASLGDLCNKVGMPSNENFTLGGKYFFRLLLLI